MQRRVLNSVQAEAASEVARVLREEFWLFGGSCSGVPSGGRPAAVATVIVVVGGLAYEEIGMLVHRDVIEVTRQRG